MTYEQFLQLQTRLEWLIDFHPGYLAELRDDQLAILREGFLLGVPDEGYPSSLELFYASQIAPFADKQAKMVEVMAELYRVSGSGNLFDDFSFAIH